MVIFVHFGGIRSILVIFGVSRIFWSFWTFLVHIGHFLGFKGILVIFRHFGSILVIIKVLLIF